jgi:hypothetical protein
MIDMHPNHRTVFGWQQNEIDDVETNEPRMN